MRSAAGGVGCGIRLRHALAFAADLQREVVDKRRTIKAVAKSLGLSEEQCRGVVRILRRHGMRSPERLALVAMRDWGLDDSDVAEMFGRSERWAAIVRSQADEIRAEEPIDNYLEFVDCGLRPEDPSPDEILRRAAELRKKPDFKGRFVGSRTGHWLIPNYSWTKDHAFIPLGAA